MGQIPEWIVLGFTGKTTIIAEQSWLLYSFQIDQQILLLKSSLNGDFHTWKLDIVKVGNEKNIAYFMPQSNL